MPAGRALARAKGIIAASGLRMVGGGWVGKKLACIASWVKWNIKKKEKESDERVESSAVYGGLSPQRDDRRRRAERRPASVELKAARWR